MVARWWGRGRAKGRDGVHEIYGGGGGELKRAKTHRTNMNDAAPEETAAATATRVVIPTASTRLRISAAPKSITERHVLSMVNELNCMFKWYSL